MPTVIALFGSTVTWTSGVALTRLLLRLTRSGWSASSPTIATDALSTSALDWPVTTTLRPPALNPPAETVASKPSVRSRVHVRAVLQLDRHRRAVGGPALDGGLEDLRARVALGRDARLDEFHLAVGEQDRLGLDGLLEDRSGARAARRRDRDDERRLGACVD